jgi:hypothetical protein
MPANVQTMAYYGEVPWHGLGKQVLKGVTAQQMIQAAGLDWEVEPLPARGAREINRKGKFSRYEVVRVPIVELTTFGTAKRFRGRSLLAKLAQPTSLTEESAV